MAIDRDKVLAAAQKYVEKKKYDKAVAEYQKVIQEDPNDARTLLKVGDLQSKMEAYADAVVTYERVGKFYASQGFALKAIAVYKQIREIIAKHLPQLEDRYGHISPKLAELYQQLGLTSDALAALDEVATRLQRQNKDGEAIEVFRKIVDLDPTNPLPHLRLAEALSRVKDADGAVSEFALAAGQLAKLGRRDDAIKVLERLLHHKADGPHARTAAELYLARNQPNDGMLALAKLQICFQANPRDLDTLGLLAKAFNLIGQAAKGIEVQKEMARIARDSGKVDTFRELLGKLQKLAPNDEGVKRLAASSMAPPPGGAAPVQAPSRRSAQAADDAYELDDEEIGDEDLENDAAIELSRRSAQPQDDGEVVVESSFDVVEEVGDTPVVDDASEQIQRVLADAASFRRAGFHAKAIETLRIGLEINPRSIDVHVQLREVLMETGETYLAIDVMLDLAGLQIDGLDGDAAARTLQDLLELDPHNARAAQMLQELGYELVEEPASVSTQTAAERVPPMRGEYASASSYDPEAPLPSYDLEEIGPEDVALRSYSEGGQRAATPNSATSPHAAPMDDIDDPFGEAPLPSFPLEPATDSAADGAAAFDLLPDEDAIDAGESSPALDQTQGTVAATPELESVLEEAEFFTSRGLFDDARTIIQEQLARLPKHPLLLERLAEIDAQERGVVHGSGPRPSPGSVDEQEDRSFDIAASLDGGDRASGYGPSSPAFAAASEQVDVEEVFAKFKEGVAKQIGADDAQSHYDLGVAYKEMGLVDDAIREFDTATRDPKLACVSHSMVGMIHLERGNINEAIDAFVRGLQAPDRTKEQEVALDYEVASAYEAKRMNKQALDYFQRAARLMPTFRDVQERVRRLQKTEPKSQAPRAVAVGADDEFDRAFDDILGDGKIP